MYTNIWGPSAWRLIHSIAFTYPIDPTFIDKQRYKIFFESLAYTLPCKDCQYNYQKELLNFDLDEALNSREGLSRWAFNLHNSVNKRLNKKIMTYEEVKTLYDELIKNVDREKKEINQSENHKNHKIYDTFKHTLNNNKELFCMMGFLGIGYLYYKHCQK